MKIAFFGSSLVSAYWNGAATYYRGIIRALAHLRHSVTFYEPDVYDRQQHRDMEPPPWAHVIVYAAAEDALARQLERARAADVIVKASGIGIFDELLERAVLDLRRPGNLVVFWDVDAPATLERVNADPADRFRPLIPRYDLVLTYGGGPPVVAGYTALGARQCVPIYNALDPATHHRAGRDSRFACDLAFAANRLPDREARVEEFFLRAASLAPHRSFLLAGNGWQDKPVPQNVRSMGHLYTRDHNAFNSTALAVLNVNRDSMARYGYSPPTRIFEAAGAAACIITDAWNGLGLFLEPGVEALVAHDGAEVAAQLDALTPERAWAIGESAMRRVMAEHTYAQRAEQVERLLGAAHAAAGTAK